jgi:hypothetical protein
MNANAEHDTAVKRSAVGNIDDQRLLRRARFLDFMRDAGMGGGRIDFAFRIAEQHAIVAELVRRHGAGALLLVPLAPAERPHVLRQAALGS